MGFFDKALERARKVGAPLCLGLDPRDESVERFSHSGLYTMLYDRYVRNLHVEGFRSLAADSVYVKLKLYCLHLLESTAEHVCCVKPNLAFFIAQGAEGVQALMDLCEIMRAMDIPILLDAKLGDIGSTMEYYKRFIFDVLKADCCTVNTLLGTDVLKAMATNKEGEYVNDLFVLAKCSNPSSDQIQGATLSNQTKVYIELVGTCENFYVENKVTAARLGYVVGATCVDALRDIREKYPESIILMPGIGAQGGDLAAALKAALNSRGEGVIVPISRAIIDTQNPGQSAEYWKEQIKSHITQ